MKRIVTFLLSCLMLVGTITFFTPASAKECSPDYYLNAVDLFAASRWLKNGVIASHPDAEEKLIKFIPSGTISNGFGFETDIPVNFARYAVARYYSNVSANSLQIAYSHNSTFDYTKQYGIASVINTPTGRVALFDLSSAADSAKHAGLDSIKYVKILPWSGQLWSNSGETDSLKHYFNLYSLAFFESEEEAISYSNELRSSLPPVDEDQKYDNEKADIETKSKSDTTAIDAIINEFKSKRVDNPFIKGYDNGKLFKPDGNMTRAEACTIITRLLTAEEAVKGKYTSKFTDVRPGAWYYDNIGYLESKGYLDAYSNTFEPDKNITRAEFVELVYKMGKIEGGDKEISFDDVPETHPRYNVIMAAAKSGLVNGKSETKFDPDGSIKRSEVVKVICTAMGRTPTNEGIINASGFLDVNKSHWAYPYIVEATYCHKLTVNENGNEIWENIVENELIIYPEYPEQIGRNYDYEVTVSQGDKSCKIPVYNEVRQYSAGVRNPYGDEYRRFCEFAFTGDPVRIDIKVNTSFDEYTLIPAIRDLPSTVNENIISVYVNEPMQFILRLGNDIKSSSTMLAVFVDPPEENIPDKNDENVIWIEGWYEAPGKELHLTKDQTLYIAPGAVLNSRVIGSGDNMTITGRGMVRDPYDTRSNNVHCQNYNINIKNSSNVLIDGIKVVDCRFYHIYFEEVRNSEINNVKIFSNQISTDGFLLSAYDTYIHDSFADVGDDVFTGGGHNKVYENMLVGSTCGIFSLSGARTETYKNISIFRADEAIFKNYYGKGPFNGAVFENIYAVDCPFTPYFFTSSNQGALPKIFEFKNLSLNTPSGVGDKCVYFDAYTNTFINLANGGNFDFNFENLYVDGKLISSADELVINDRATEGKTNVNITVNEKISADIPLAPNTTYLETPYTAPKKSVAPLEEGVNLLEEYGGIEKGLAPFTTEGFSYFRETDDAHSGNTAMLVPGNDNNDVGISLGIYDIISRGGKGVYTLEFWAKHEKESVGKDIYAGVTMTHGEASEHKSMTKINKYQVCRLTDEWQKYTITFNVPDNNVRSAYLRFVSHSGAVTMTFLLDDISLTYSPKK